MKRRRRRPAPLRAAITRVGFLALLALAACGSRTGLWGTDLDNGNGDGDGGTGEGGTRRDGGLIDGAIPDALPPIDATPRDANRVDCPDADATLVYLISVDYELLSFDPATGTVTNIGNIACPAHPDATPFSMAVDRKGVAYILFSNQSGGGNNSGPDDGKLFRVSTATAACIGTSFVPNQLGFLRFGMGFATNDVGPTEQLFIAGSEQSNGAEGLGTIDTTSFKLSKVGNFVPNIRNAELTGTGDGRLYALYTKTALNQPAYIGEINTLTGQVIAETRFNDVDLGNAWAFAAWGGDFYMFTAPGGTTEVTRWRPSNNTTTVVANLSTRIVGAGVSTCAPSQ